jgi:hypothetical protein
VDCRVVEALPLLLAMTLAERECLRAAMTEEEKGG